MFIYIEINKFTIISKVVAILISIVIYIKQTIYKNMNINKTGMEYFFNIIPH